jgi:hypothetical protein
MTWQRPAPAADSRDAAPASIRREASETPEPPSGFERSERADFSRRQTGEFARPPAPIEGSLDSAVVEELTRRLPTSELVKIIKGALECGRQNLPFTESDLLRAMTFGSSALPTRQPVRGPRSPRG